MHYLFNPMPTVLLSNERWVPRSIVCLPSCRGLITGSSQPHGAQD